MKEVTHRNLEGKEIMSLSNMCGVTVLDRARNEEVRRDRMSDSVVWKPIQGLRHVERTSEERLTLKLYGLKLDDGGIESNGLLRNVPTAEGYVSEFQ